MNRVRVAHAQGGASPFSVYGWVDMGKARVWERPTGGQSLLCSATGKWALRRQGEPWYWATPEQARDWLTACGFSGAVLEHFGLASRPRPGRPKVGGMVGNVRLGDLLPRVDQYSAEERCGCRAEAIRELIGLGLAAHYGS